jgi:hypothetical protein
MRIPLGLFFLFFFSTSAFATFAPDNDLWKQDSLYLGLDGSGGLNETQFGQVIDKVAEALQPSVALHGGSLVVNRLWTTATVNASSGQLFGTWTVNMYGGLARRPEITVDGFTLVMCHEMGHHLGGFPFYSLMGRWAAAEGQADYFATEVCAHKVWQNEAVENARFRSDVDQTAKAKCDGIWSNPDDQNLCYRTSAASQSLASLLSVLDKSAVPQFSTPDKLEVTTTNASYGSTQCRLDTYLNGSLCTAKFDLGVIPGRHKLVLFRSENVTL